MKMAIRAKMPNKSCPRCLRPIAVDDWIEEFYRTEGGRRHWAHRGCCAIQRQDDNYDQESARETVKSPQQRSEQEPEGHHDVTVAAPTIPTGAGLLTRVRAELAAIVGEVVIKTVPGFVTEQVHDAATELLGQTAQMVKEIERNLSGRILDAIRAEVEKMPPKEIVLKDGDTVRKLPKGEVYQPCFERMLRLGKARKNILLIGPTGSGKTHTAKQLAEALGLPFGVISCSGGLTEAKLMGRVTPNVTEGESVYQESEFVRLYENGGVYCLDELDGADPNMTLVLNSAIANDFLGVPDRKDKPIAKRHKDFILVATANTWGHGSTRKFVGRYPIDEATLDRFRVGTIEVGYCVAVERHLVRGNQEVFDRLTEWREKIVAANLERVLSTRFFRDVADMMAVGDTWKDIEQAFFGGWKKEEIMKVLGRTLAA
jgi:MoxR-like ATPase